MKKHIQKYWNKHLILLQISNLYFWKSWIVWIYVAIITPLISMMIMYAFNQYATTMMPSILIYPFIFTLYVWAAIIVELKRNSIIEKIFIFSKKPIYSNAVIAIYFFLLTFLSFWWNLFIIFLFSLDKNLFSTDLLFKNVDWGAIVFIALLSSFLVISISSMLYTFMNSVLKTQLVGGLLMIFFMIFSGSFIPINTITNVDALHYISYFSPLKYISSLLIVAMNNGGNNINQVNIFDFSKDFEIWTVSNVNGTYEPIKMVLFHSYDMVLNIFVPLILTIVFLSISLNSRIGKRK